MDTHLIAELKPIHEARGWETPAFSRAIAYSHYGKSAVKQVWVFFKRKAYSLMVVHVSGLKLANTYYTRRSSHKDQCHAETLGRNDSRWWEMLPLDIFVPSGLFQPKVLCLSLIFQEDVVRLKTSITSKISHSVTLRQGFSAQETLKSYQGEGQFFILYSWRQFIISYFQRSLHFAPLPEKLELTPNSSSIKIKKGRVHNSF